jgi:hypothetical protein
MKKSNPTKKKIVKKVYTPKITWQVEEDGPVHEIPEGVTVSFYTKEGLVQTRLLNGQLAILDLRD